MTDIECINYLDDVRKENGYPPQEAGYYNYILFMANGHKDISSENEVSEDFLERASDLMISDLDEPTEERVIALFKHWTYKSAPCCLINHYIKVYPSTLMKLVRQERLTIVGKDSKDNRYALSEREK